LGRGKRGRGREEDWGNRRLGDGEGKDQRSEGRGQRSVRDTKNEQRVEGTWRWVQVSLNQRWERMPRVCALSTASRRLLTLSLP
jgi:hypothetical protein